jgi:hypothetical protein
MKKFLTICLAATLALSMAACQATPEKNIVIGKSLDNMIENATKSEAPDGSAEPGGTQGGSIADKMGAQATFTDELTDGTGKVKIHVNADVEVPDATGITVQRVERVDFTQEQVDVLVQNLMHGDLFSGDDFKLSKSEIQQQILDIQEEMAKNGESATVSPEPGKGKDFDRNMRQFTLDDLQKQLETAPDTATKTPSDGKLVPMDESEGTGVKLYALAQSDNGYESLDVCNDAGSAVNYLNYTSEKNGFARDMGYFYTKDEVARYEGGSYFGMTSQDVAQIPDVSITEDQAKQKAEDLIKALGLENMVCYSAIKEYGGSEEKTADQTAYINPRKCVWFLRYERSVNGVPVTYTPWDCMKVEEESQSAPWSYEDMTFAIDDSGIVGFTWRSPYKITDTVTQDSNVLPFSDVTEIFNTMAPVVNAWDGFSQGSPTLTGVEITVDDIKFGLTRVTEQNKRDSGLLVPAWDFMGTMTQIINQNGQEKRYDDGPIPILTINAIDGSIINRSLGY